MIDYRHYIYAGSEPVAIDSRKSDGTNALYYLLTDHQGSIAGITNSAGSLVVGESFTAYGNRRNPTTWSGAPNATDLSAIAGITRRGYTFQNALGQTGLNDMVGRVQDAITGRFLSADPTIPHPTDPQSYNPYSYVRNNPVTYTDPTGFADGPNVVWYNGPWDPIVIQSTPLPPDGTDPYNGDQIASGGSSSGSTGSASGNGELPASGTAPSNPQPQTPQKPQAPQQQSNQACAYVACPVVTAPKGLTPSEPPLVTSFFGLDDLLGLLQNEILNAIGCKGTSCKVIAAVLLPAVLKGVPGKYTLTDTVEKNLASRPYLNSPLTIQEIQDTGLGVPDPGGIPGALRYDVPGAFNGSQGTWELVIDPNTNTVYHFLFTSGK